MSFNCTSRSQFGYDTQLYTLLTPYFLYPFTWIAVTSSAYVTVALLLQRLLALTKSSSRGIV